jgi:hypothetical protein
VGQDAGGKEEEKEYFQAELRGKGQGPHVIRFARVGPATHRPRLSGIAAKGQGRGTWSVAGSCDAKGIAQGHCRSPPAAYGALQGGRIFGPGVVARQSDGGMGGAVGQAGASRAAREGGASFAGIGASSPTSALRKQRSTSTPGQERP